MSIEVHIREILVLTLRARRSEKKSKFCASQLKEEK